jgi:hypothetical protein
MFYLGNGVAVDQARGRKLWLDSFAKGNVNAALPLSIEYERGDTQVPQDWGMVRYWQIRGGASEEVANRYVAAKQAQQPIATRRQDNALAARSQQPPSADAMAYRQRQIDDALAYRQRQVANPEVNANGDAPTPTGAASHGQASTPNEQGFQPPNTIVGGFQRTVSGLATAGNAASDVGNGDSGVGLLGVGVGIQCAQEISGTSLTGSDRERAIAACERHKLKVLKKTIGDINKQNNDQVDCYLKDRDTCPEDN